MDKTTLVGRFAPINREKAKTLFATNQKVFVSHFQGEYSKATFTQVFKQSLKYYEFILTN